VRSERKRTPVLARLHVGAYQRKLGVGVVRQLAGLVESPLGAKRVARGQAGFSCLENLPVFGGTGMTFMPVR
jgi:hypothetical protein